MGTGNWIVRHSVPILDEHVLKDDEGEELVKIDAAKLQEIAKRNNTRVQETGDWTPLVIGHTKDDDPEKDQPEIVGYAHNFRVEPFGKTGRKALTATFKFFKDKAGKVKNYPRRSVELWLSDWKIDPIALLGATTPERDLGLLQLSRGGGRKIRRILYERPMIPGQKTNVGQQPGQPGDSMCPAGTSPDSASPDNSPQAIVQAVVEALQQTDVWKFLEQQMQDATAEAMMPDEGLGMEGLPPEGMPGEMPPEGMPPPPGEGEEYDEGFEEGEEEEEEDEPERYSASAASGTNTFTPSGRGSVRELYAEDTDDDKMGYPGSMRQRMQRPQPQGRQPARPQGRGAARQPQYVSQGPQHTGGPSAHRHASAQAQYDPRIPEIVDRIRLARDQQQGQLARYERHLKGLAAENQDLRLKFQRTERERDLIQLEAEGYLIDRVEELDHVADMPAAAYQSHMKLIRKRYQKAPLGRASFGDGDLRNPAPRGKGRDKSRALEVAEYARKKGLSYAQALDELGEED